jgi:ribosomal protein L23
MGKTKFRGNQTGKRADWKKAVIYLTKGESVDLFQ